MSDLSLCGRSMVVFNFLPSKTLHPSRMADYESSAYVAALATMPASAPLWHRRWSESILQQEGLVDTPVTDVAADGLAVAVLDNGALTVLARRIGVVLCAPRLRYAISGETVRALQATLGADVLRWVRNGPAMHPGLPGGMLHDADEAGRHVALAGYAALYAAFQSARPELARRFFLKLPPFPPVRESTESAPGEGSIDTAATGIDREVAATIGSDAAMALVMAVQAGSAMGGGDDVSG